MEEKPHDAIAQALYPELPPFHSLFNNHKHNFFIIYLGLGGILHSAPVPIFPTTLENGLGCNVRNEGCNWPKAILSQGTSMAEHGLEPGLSSSLLTLSYLYHID